MAKNTSCGVQLRIRGKVQGVGFRPFVWQLAQQLNLHGDVCNDGDGAEVRLLEDPETFLLKLRTRRCEVLHIDAEKVEDLLAQRLEARKNKDFQRSDEIRAQIAALGVEVRDTPEGQVWDLA